MSDLAERLARTKTWQGGVGMTTAEHEAMVADLIRAAVRECARAGWQAGQNSRNANGIHAAILTLIGESA